MPLSLGPLSPPQGYYSPTHRDGDMCTFTVVNGPGRGQRSVTVT